VSRLRYDRTFLYALAFTVHLGVAVVLTHPWDTYVFQRTVADFVQLGLTPYETALSDQDHLFLGRHLPIQQHWYAYPPLPLLLMLLSYFPVAFGVVENLGLGRILIKLPAIAATLVLAAAARYLVASSPNLESPGLATKRAAQAEKWFLFNPMFILIAAVWGQLEALLLVFLVAMILVLRTDRYAAAGAMWGASLLVKPFAAFLIPILSVHLVRRGGTQAALRFFGSGVLLASAVCLPFFLMEPRGFLHQTVFMHTERPPARYAPLATVYYLLREASEVWPASVPDPGVSAAVIGAISLVLTLAVLIGLTLAYTKRSSSEHDLLFALGVTILGAFLVTKVLNEQYMLLPLGMLALWTFSSNTPHPATKWFLFVGTWGLFVAAMLERAALLHWIAPDMLAHATGWNHVEVFAAIAWRLGLTIGTLRLVLGLIAGAALLVILFAAVRLVLPSLLAGWQILAGARFRLPAFKRPAPGSSIQGFPVVVVVVVALLLMGGYPAGTAILKGSGNEGPPVAAETTPQVLAVYRSDWYNPAHHRDIPAGTWGSADLTPRSGYYNLNAHKVHEDLRSMQDAGVEAVIIVLHAQHQPSTATVKRVAESIGMPYAMMLDAQLHEATRGTPAGPWDGDRLDELLSGPWLSGWVGPHHLRDEATGAPLLFLHEWERAPDELTGADGLIDAKRLAAFYPDGAAVVSTVGETTGTSGSPWKETLWLFEAMDLDDYERAWEQAAEAQKRVAVWWNAFDGGLAIEPTEQHLDAYLEATKLGISTRLAGPLGNQTDVASR
jgi:Gpi18-like mannosyltransferase